jgi:membrane protease YdiL (CAAX protease family)
VKTRIIQDGPYRPPPVPAERRIRRYRLVVFVGLAYALWWVPYAAGPLVAAVVVAALADSGAGLRDLAARLTRWRVRWYWYPVAVAVPTVVLAVDGVPSWSGAALVAALAAEVGWRAYALPRLQAVQPPLPAALVLAVIVTGWQVPVAISGGLGVEALAATSASTVWYVWLFNRTGGSALLTLLCHAVANLTAGTGWPAVAVWAAAAIVVVVVDRRAWRVQVPGGQLSGGQVSGGQVSGVSSGRVGPPHRRR